MRRKTFYSVIILSMMFALIFVIGTTGQAQANTMDRDMTQVIEKSPTLGLTISSQQYVLPGVVKAMAEASARYAIFLVLKKNGDTSASSSPAVNSMAVNQVITSQYDTKAVVAENIPNDAIDRALCVATVTDATAIQGVPLRVGQIERYASAATESTMEAQFSASNASGRSINNLSGHSFAATLT